MFWLIGLFLVKQYLSKKRETIIDKFIFNYPDLGSGWLKMNLSTNVSLFLSNNKSRSCMILIYPFYQEQLNTATQRK